MNGGGVPAEKGAFAFPNAKVEWPGPMTAEEKRAKRDRELIAELRLYHHYEAADRLEGAVKSSRILKDALAAALKTAQRLIDGAKRGLAGEPITHGELHEGVLAASKSIEKELLIDDGIRQLP